MKIPERIIIDERICTGKPCIRGTRLTVDFILELLAAGWSYKMISEEYDVETEDIIAVLRYAHQIIKDEGVYGIAP